MEGKRKMTRIVHELNSRNNDVSRDDAHVSDAWKGKDNIELRGRLLEFNSIFICFSYLFRFI